MLIVWHTQPTYEQKVVLVEPPTHGSTRSPVWPTHAVTAPVILVNSGHRAERGSCSWRLNASRHYLSVTTARLRCLAVPGTVRWLTSRSTGRCATTFGLCSARARMQSHSGQPRSPYLPALTGAGLMAGLLL